MAQPPRQGFSQRNWLPETPAMEFNKSLPHGGAHSSTTSVPPFQRAPQHSSLSVGTRDTGPGGPPVPDFGQPDVDFEALDSQSEQFSWSPTPDEIAQFQQDFGNLNEAQATPWNDHQDNTNSYAPSTYQTLISSTDSLSWNDPQRSPNTYTPSTSQYLATGTDFTSWNGLQGNQNSYTLSTSQNLTAGTDSTSQSSMRARNVVPARSFLQTEPAWQNTGQAAHDREEQEEREDEDVASDHDSSNDEESDNGVSQPVWDSSIASISQAKSFLLKHTSTHRRVSLPSDDLAVQRPKALLLAKALFDAVHEAPPKADASWGDKATYHNNYQDNGQRDVEALLRTKDGCRQAQSNCMLVIADAFDLHGTGIWTSFKNLRVDAKTKLSQRLGAMTACMKYKHAASKLAVGDAKTMTMLVLDPKGVLRARELALRNNAGKDITFQLGKKSQKSTPASAKSGRKTASGFKTALGSLQSMAQPSTSSSPFYEGNDDATDAGAQTPMKKRRRETHESSVAPSSAVRPMKRVAVLSSSTPEGQTAQGYFSPTLNTPSQTVPSRIPGFGPDSYTPQGYCRPTNTTFRFDNTFMSQAGRSQTGYTISQQSVPMAHQGRPRTNMFEVAPAAVSSDMQFPTVQQISQASSQASLTDSHDTQTPGAFSNTKNV